MRLRTGGRRGRTWIGDRGGVPGGGGERAKVKVVAVDTGGELQRPSHRRRLHVCVPLVSGARDPEGLSFVCYHYMIF